MYNTNNLNEASLSRVYKHFTDPETTVVILTGFRDGVDIDTNKRRNVNIGSNLKNAGFGYFYVDGYWTENKGTPEEVKVSEDSIFAITTNPNKSRNLINLAHELANKYNQDAILVKEPLEAYFLNKNGSKTSLGSKIHPGKIGEFYTQLRNKKKANTFVFEAEREAIGYMKSFRDFILENN